MEARSGQWSGSQRQRRSRSDLNTGAGTAEEYDKTAFDAALKAFPWAGKVVREWRWSPSRPEHGPVMLVEILYRGTQFDTVKIYGGKTYFPLQIVRSEAREQGELMPSSGLSPEENVLRTDHRPGTMLSQTFWVAADWDRWKGGATLQRLHLDYDDRLNLSWRRDSHGSSSNTEYFKYDRLDRLTCAQLWSAPTCAEPYQYAPNGNLLFKPEVGAYTYDPEHQPHAARAAGGETFGYNEVGNQVRMPGATVDFTPFDLPRTFTLDGGAGKIELADDGDQARVRKTAPTEETLYAGDLYERVTNRATGAVEHRYDVHASERAVAVVTLQARQPKRELYLHVDQLGSVEVLSDESGAVVERRSYDAFGARRHPRWDWPSPPSFSSRAKRGFTGHEGDDELGLVNMKGRIYSPKVGRFLTPDPIVSRPQFSQSWNTYS